MLSKYVRERHSFRSSKGCRLVLLPSFACAILDNKDSSEPGFGFSPLCSVEAWTLLEVRLACFPFVLLAIGSRKCADNIYLLALLRLIVRLKDFVSSLQYRLGKGHIFNHRLSMTFFLGCSRMRLKYLF